MNTTVNGEPVPETSGNTAVSFDGAASPHVACDTAITGLRGERDDLRALLAEILGTYKPTPEGHSAPSVISVVSPERYARWSERAERNAGAAGSQPNGDGPEVPGADDETPEAAGAGERPSPFALWQQSGGNRELYRDLLRKHGHILSPGDEGYDEARQYPDCGWKPRGEAS